MPVGLLSIAALSMLQSSVALPADPPGAGQMTIVGKEAVSMPLERTDVNAWISGIGARVTVKQHFRNPSTSAIEAVYTFPLPHDAAVDRMRIKVGDRIVDGEIKEREAARRIYEAARNAGQTAALLDQERPNIFTQSVANIMPGVPIDVEISYVQTLKYDSGKYEFSFPMVVGPRFIAPGTKSPDKISPPITPQNTRSGQTISLHAEVDAGAPILDVSSVLHQTRNRAMGTGRMVIDLAKKDEIPNRDFILRYRVATDKVQSAVLQNFDGAHGGHLGLILLPPQKPAPQQIRPKEVIFVMDQSGSQSGFPIEKSKELTLKLIKTLRPGDTFNVLGFNTTVRSLWPEPRALDAANLNAAADFVKGMEANGGTMIREGVVAALAGQNDPRRLRIVLLNTDGYVGDEPVILKSIREHRNKARMFVFGIGGSVNRYLIDAMAEEGKGASAVVTLSEEADAAVSRFVKRLETPVLTDVSVKFDGVNVTDVEPAQIPDVFDNTPVVLYGKFATAGKGTVTISGRVGNEPWSSTVPLDLRVQPGAASLPSLWARRRVESMERERFMAGFTEGARPPQSEEIARLALDYGIMSAYTSFVAVEQRVVNIGGKVRTVRVPVEMPEGVSYDGIFGSNADGRLFFASGKSSSNVVRRLPVAGAGFGGGAPASAPSGLFRGGRPQEEYRATNASPNKIDKRLQGKKGLLDVQILVDKLSEENIDKLVKLGLVVEGKEASLKAIFGKVDAAKLESLSKLEFVQRITPIEG